LKQQTINPANVPGFLFLGFMHSLEGVSLLAIAVCQSTNIYLTYRYREQAHSYKGIFGRLGRFRGILHLLNTDAFPCW